MNQTNRMSTTDKEERFKTRINILFGIATVMMLGLFLNGLINATANRTANRVIQKLNQAQPTVNMFMGPLATPALKILPETSSLTNDKSRTLPKGLYIVKTTEPVFMRPEDRPTPYPYSTPSDADRAAKRAAMATLWATPIRSGVETLTDQFGERVTVDWASQEVYDIVPGQNMKFDLDGGTYLVTADGTLLRLE